MYLTIVYSAAASFFFSFASFASFDAQYQQNNITYSVISNSFLNTSIAVVVDSVIFPLQASHNILYKGQAPVAKTGYHYAIINANNVINVTEPFDRPPIEMNTVNEFFNRSTNVYNFTVLPQAMAPISVMNRIKSNLHVYNQIPTMHLWGNKTAIEYLHNNTMDDIKVKLNMTYFGLNDTQEFEKVIISLSGRSSRYTSKVSYSIKIKNKGKYGSLYGYKHIKLRAMAYDGSYKREMLCHSFLKSIGTPASEFSYIRLFIDNKPVGLFGIIENFQKPWSANEFENGENNYSPGHFYHSIGLTTTNASELTQEKIGDLNYYNNLTVYSAGQYKIKDGPSRKKVESFSGLQGFTKFINKTSILTTESEWDKYLDTDGFLRAMAAENLLGLADAYMTLSDNYNLYMDPKRGGRMIYIPSDFDTSLGSPVFNVTLMHSGNYSQFPGLTMRPLTKKFFSNKMFASAYQELLLNLTQSTMNPSVVGPYLDNIDSMISSDVEWDQQLARLGKVSNTAVTGSSLPDLSAFMPPGYMTNLSQSHSENILEFVSAKSAAVLEFFNQPSAA